jgi:hypothetical protein
MKKMIILLMVVFLSSGAFAQRKVIVHRVPVTRVYVSPFSYGIGFGYPYFGYPPFYGFGYPYPYPAYRYRSIPYELNLQIEQIQNEYKGKILDVRKDKSISGKQRRQEIRTLKNQRDQDITSAKMNFHRQGRNQMNRNNNTAPGNQDQHQGNVPPENQNQNQGNTQPSHDQGNSGNTSQPS